MLDSKSLALLDGLCTVCEGYGYKVFSIEELSGFLPQTEGDKILQTRACLKVLSDSEYVSVKYQDETEICLCILNKSRLFFENRIDGEVEKNAFMRTYAISSFLGALVGGALTLILAIIIALIFGWV